MKTAERFEDMSQRGRLRIHQQEDGDMIVCVITDPNDPESAGAMCSVEFCTSGGKSPKTREAIRNLMLAMAEENAEKPHCGRRGEVGMGVDDEAPHEDQEGNLSDQELFDKEKLDAVFTNVSRMFTNVSGINGQLGYVAYSVKDINGRTAGSVTISTGGHVRVDVGAGSSNLEKKSYDWNLPTRTIDEFESDIECTGLELIRKIPKPPETANSSRNSQEIKPNKSPAQFNPLNLENIYSNVFCIRPASDQSPTAYYRVEDEDKKVAGHIACPADGQIWVEIESPNFWSTTQIKTIEKFESQIARTGLKLLHKPINNQKTSNV